VQNTWADSMMYQTLYRSVLGSIILTSDGTGLTGLCLEGQKNFCLAVRKELPQRDNLPVFLQTKEWLNRYFAGENPSGAEILLTPYGSPFRQTVWKLLCQIPYGQVTTYGELARRVAAVVGKEQMSAQAVGGAVGHNPISILIPCHRVVGAGGNLTGYDGGLDKKVKLLKLEGALRPEMYIPEK